MPIVSASNSKPSDIHDTLKSLGCASNWQTIPPMNTRHHLLSTQQIQDMEEWTTPFSDRAIMALRAILDGVGGTKKPRSWEGLEDWLEEIITVPFEPIIFSHSSRDHNVIWGAKRSYDALKVAADLAQNLSSIISGQAMRVKRQVEVLSLQHGLCSLPDDILSDLLVLSIECEISYDSTSITERGKKRLWGALRLSHVCSRIRLLLDRPRLWNFLSDEIPNANLVRHCIKNAQNAPLRLYVHNRGSPLPRYKFEEFIAACLENGGNWKVLDFETPYLQVTSEEEIARQNAMSDNISSFQSLTAGHEFRSLEYLDMCYREPFTQLDHRDEKFHPYLHWSLPSLRRISYAGGFPIPFHNNIKNLCITYVYSSGLSLDLHQLVEFFASCSSLEGVELCLHCWRSVAPCKTAKIPGVETIAFIFRECPVDAILNVCDALYFPDAKQMTLRFNFKFLYWSWDDDEDFVDPLPSTHLDYAGVISDVLSQHCYAGLTSLHIDLSPRNFRGNDEDDPQAVPDVSYLPPFMKLPDLKDLSLSSSRSGWEDIGWEDIGLLEIPEKVRIPALRSLTIFMKWEDWHRVSGWVKTLIARLEKQGDLDKFNSLRIGKVEKYFKREESEWDTLKQEIHKFISKPTIRVETI
ncbi:hypothetical protein SCHPADRAFT_904614, partial [Schizopora paradoxa]